MNEYGFKYLLRESAGLLWRELRISLAKNKAPDKWVFVIGCANSGTTLLSKLMGLHPSIATMPEEGQFLTTQLTVDLDVGLPRMWTRNEWLFRMNEKIDYVDADRIKKEWSMRFNKDADIFLEHSPPHSARTLWLQNNFPNAYFINVIRNGYAVAEGIRRKAIPYYMPEGWPIEWTALHWKRSCEIVNEDAGKLKHIMDVRYEDLSAAPDTVLSEILDFLELGPLDHSVGSLNVAVHERSELIKNMNHASIKNLMQEDIVTIQHAAGSMLDFYDYGVND